MTRSAVGRIFTAVFGDVGEASGFDVVAELLRLAIGFAILGLVVFSFALLDGGSP